MNTQRNLLALASTAAIVAAGLMLILGILGNMGLYLGGVEAMQQWHIFFSLSIGGIIAGMIEAIVVTFVIVYVSGWLYNKLSQKFGT